MNPIAKPALEQHPELEPEFVVTEADLVTTCYYLPQPEPGGSYDYFHFDTYRVRDGALTGHWSGDNKIVPARWERPVSAARQPVEPGPALPQDRLEANKRLVLDAYRHVFDAQDPAAVKDYFAEGYRQHDPEMPPGRAGLEQFVRTVFPDGPVPVPPEPLVPPAILLAEGNLVIYAVCRPQPDPGNPGGTYDYYLYNAFRISEGKLAEHWSGRNKAAPLAPG